MVKSPCCDNKMELKRGPWTPEEDRILVSFIQRCGHGNWRALPKQAGLMRCGKSCRLRWMNYLRPDIKRGNFSKEEEEAIISLHQLLGNRWSAIAAKLPGRTDNEIKNVWHTHLKKRATPSTATPPGKKSRSSACRPGEGCATNNAAASPLLSTGEVLCTPTESASAMTGDTNPSSVEECNASSLEMFVDMGEGFWSEALPLERSWKGSDTSTGFYGQQLQSEGGCTELALFDFVGGDDHRAHAPCINEDGLDFWLGVLMGKTNHELPSS